MKKTNRFHFDKGFYKTAMALAIPIALQNLLTSCATLIDTAMVTGLGNDAISAMGVAARFSFIINVVCFGIGSGCTALLSQYWGAKDLPNLRRSFGVAMMLSAILAVIFVVALAVFPTAMMRLFTDGENIVALGANYLRIFSIGVPFIILSQLVCIALRSVESVKIPLISAGVGVVINTALNYCLIFGRFGFPELGLRGAAIASVVGYSVQVCILLVAILISKNPFRTRLSAFFDFRMSFVKKYLRIATPALLNELMWGVGTNIYVMVLARQGVENHAGYTLFENIQQLFFVFFVGICSAASVMVGMRTGQSDHDGAYTTAKRFAVMTPILGVVFGGILILLRNPILSLFPVETEGTRVVASACLLFYGCWLAMRMIPYTLICGIFRAGGDTKMGCVYDLVGLYGFGIPTVLILGLWIHPSFIVLVASMFIAEDTLKGVLCLIHFRSRKWIKQITAPTE